MGLDPFADGLNAMQLQHTFGGELLRNCGTEGSRWGWPRCGGCSTWTGVVPSTLAGFSRSTDTLSSLSQMRRVKNLLCFLTTCKGQCMVSEVGLVLLHVSQKQTLLYRDFLEPEV